MHDSAFQSDPASWWAAWSLAKTWTRLHQPGEAVEVWREHVDQLRAAIPADDRALAKAARALIGRGMELLKNDQAKDAEPVLRECLLIREKVLKKDDWLIANARSNLGESLTGQGADSSLALGVRIEKLREAEALLVESANALQGNDKTPEIRKTEAVQRVVDLYEAWHAAEPGQGYDAKADEWRATLAPRASDIGG